MTTPRRRCLALLSTLLLGLSAGPLLLPAATAHADGAPVVQVAPASAAPGSTTTVTGSGWPGNTLLIVLICGQNALSGTDSCANPTGRAVTTRADGGFSVPLAVVAPPKPCPCVIHITTVLGTKTTVDTPITVPGVPVVPIPPGSTAARLVALSEDLSGDSGLMNWFGAPAHRTFKVIVADMGNAPVTNPVFRLGTSQSVFAPEWQDFQWNGVIAPGAKQEIDVPVDFASGAHGAFKLELDYGTRELVTQKLTLPRSWGVTLFWLLLCVVIPVGLFRIGLAVLDRVRPDLAARRGQRLDERRERRRGELGRRRAGDPLPPPRPSSSPMAPRSPLPQPSSATQDTLVLPPIPDHPPVYPAEPVLPWFPPGTIPSLSQVRTPGSPAPTRKGT